jgi:tRNA (cmo5U34)-methyltransferase
MTKLSPPVTKAQGTEADRLFAGQISAEYDILKLICPAAAKMSARVGSFVAAQPKAPDRPFVTVEIGCGTGVTTLALLEARPDLILTAIDNEPAMLLQARSNLAEFLDLGRLTLVEADALSALRNMPALSVDAVASAYTLHNFLDSYRASVLSEIFRVLRPGGFFINGDRYALDDTEEQTRLTQDEARHYFKILGGLHRYDLLEEWILHLFSDESADRLMRLEPAITRLRETGFEDVEVKFRDGVNTLVAAFKPEGRLKPGLKHARRLAKNGSAR